MGEVAQNLRVEDSIGREIRRNCRCRRASEYILARSTLDNPNLAGMRQKSRSRLFRQLGS